MQRMEKEAKLFAKRQNIDLRERRKPLIPCGKVYESKKTKRPRHPKRDLAREMDD